MLHTFLWMIIYFKCFLLPKFRFSSRLWRVRQSPSRWNPATALTMSKQRFRIRKAFLPINSVWFLLESSWRMGAPLAITIFRRSQLCIWCYVSVGVCTIRLWLHWLRLSIAIERCAVSAMSASLLVLPTAGRRSVDILLSFAPRRSWNRHAENANSDCFLS